MGKNSLIESLLLASIAAHLSTQPLFQLGLEEVEDDQQFAMSFQRIAQVAVALAPDFIRFLLNSAREYFDQLWDKVSIPRQSRGL